MNEHDVKIGKLEVRMGNVEEKLSNLIDNHIPHIQYKIDEVHDKQTYWGGVIAVLTILIPVLVHYLFK